MRRLAVLVAAALAGAFAAPAVASAAPNQLVFENVTCGSIIPRDVFFFTTTFRTTSNGNWSVAQSPEGNFQPLRLQLTVNGDLTITIKNNVDKAHWLCGGQTTVDSPEGPVVISFVARGDFHPATTP